MSDFDYMEFKFWLSSSCGDIHYSWEQAAPAFQAQNTESNWKCTAQQLISVHQHSATSRGHKHLTIYIIIYRTIDTSFRCSEIWCHRLSVRLMFAITTIPVIQQHCPYMKLLAIKLVCCSTVQYYTLLLKRKDLPTARPLLATGQRHEDNYLLQIWCCQTASTQDHSLPWIWLLRLGACYLQKTCTAQWV